MVWGFEYFGSEVGKMVMRHILKGREWIVGVMVLGRWEREVVIYIVEG